MSAKKSKAELLELRRRIKSGKPEFIRQDYGHLPTLKRNWRRPRGIHSKLRLNKRGHGKNVSRGFGSPAEVKGLSREGLRPILLSDPKKMASINPAEEGIIIRAGTGLKKRIAILKEALARKIKVLNVKDPAMFLKNAEEGMKKKKETKAEKTEIKKKKKEELEKKAKEKEKEKKLEEALTDEEKKEKDKEEKDKVLTKKT